MAPLIIRVFEVEMDSVARRRGYRPTFLDHPGQPEFFQGLKTTLLAWLVINVNHVHTRQSTWEHQDVGQRITLPELAEFLWGNRRAMPGLGKKPIAPTVLDRFLELWFSRKDVQIPSNLVIECNIAN